MKQNTEERKTKFKIRNEDKEAYKKPKCVILFMFIASAIRCRVCAEIKRKKYKQLSQ